jgi:hypothetical protein
MLIKERGNAVVSRQHPNRTAQQVYNGLAGYCWWMTSANRCRSRTITVWMISRHYP